MLCSRQKLADRLGLSGDCCSGKRHETQEIQDMLMLIAWHLVSFAKVGIILSMQSCISVTFVLLIIVVGTIYSNFRAKP